MNKSIYRPVDWRLTLTIAVIAQFLTAIGFQMFAPFLPLYVRGLDSTFHITVELAAGFAIGAAGFAQMFSSALWGAIADRYGRKVMLLRATFGGMILLGMMGFVSTSEQLIGLRLLQGFVTGTVAATNALVASVTPRERIGFAMGMLNVSLWSGQALGPLVGGILADAFGYSTPFVITASLLAFAGILIVLGIRETFTPNFTQRPSVMAQWKHAMQARGIPTIFSIRLLVTVARNVLAPIAPLFVITLLPTHEVNQGTYAGLVSSVGAFSMVLGGLYFGRRGDRLGQRRVLIFCALGTTLLYIPQAFVSNVWQLVFLQVVVGFAFGGLVSSLAALLALYGASGEEGAIYGIDGSVTAGGFAIAPLCGSLVSLVVGMRGTFIFSALLCFAVFLVASYRLPKAKQAGAIIAVGD